MVLGLAGAEFRFVLLENGEGDADRSALVHAGLDLDVAAELTDALTDAAQAHAGAADAKFGQFFAVHAAALVADFHHHFSGFACDADPRTAAAGVSMNVAQTFLDHSKNGQFHFARRALEAALEF